MRHLGAAVSPIRGRSGSNGKYGQKLLLISPCNIFYIILHAFITETVVHQIWTYIHFGHLFQFFLQFLFIISLPLKFSHQLLCILSKLSTIWADSLRSYQLPFRYPSKCLGCMKTFFFSNKLFLSVGLVYIVVCNLSSSFMISTSRKCICFSFLVTVNSRSSCNPLIYSVNSFNNSSVPVNTTSISSTKRCQALMWMPYWLGSTRLDSILSIKMFAYPGPTGDPIVAAGNALPRI